MSARFAAVRVRCFQRDYRKSELRPGQWLLIEWPKNEAERIKDFLSALPADTPIEELVRVAKLRWRIERDYQELKQAFGLDGFEGRSWHGFHHHSTLRIASYCFVPAQRLAHPKELCRIRYGARSLPYPKTSASRLPCELSATSRTQSQHCASNSPPL